MANFVCILLSDLNYDELAPHSAAAIKPIVIIKRHFGIAWQSARRAISPLGGTLSGAWATNWLHQRRLVAWAAHFGLALSGPSAKRQHPSAATIL